MNDANHGARRLFCFGLGYSGRALARTLIADGWAVAGSCRDPAARAAAETEGIAACVFDGERPSADATRLLAGASHLLSTVPPTAEGDPVLAHHAADIAHSDSLEWIGYLSTTAVYGDHQGAWVDEETPRAPTSDRARWRAEAEDQWLNYWWGHGIAVQIFRLAGIYGPGRGAVAAVRAGAAKRIDKPGHLFSRIHVDDMVAVLRASMARPNGGRVYNVCDDRPASQAEVVAHACALLGVAPPPLAPFDAAALTPMARSFYADNKRVRNGRIKTELGVNLAYPDYRAGLAALVGADR